MGKLDDEQTAFPASEDTPGQAASRGAYARLRARLETYPWVEDYLRLRERGWDWRKAVYIAWASLPTFQRRPETQQELATAVPGLRTAHTISKWKRKFPEIDDAIAELQAAPLLKYRADVFEALGQVASQVDTRASADRKLFFEMTGDYKRRASVDVHGDVDVSGKDGFGEMDDDALEQYITNLQAATGAAGAGVDGEETPPDAD